MYRGGRIDIVRSMVLLAPDPVRLPPASSTEPTRRMVRARPTAPAVLAVPAALAGLAIPALPARAAVLAHPAGAAVLAGPAGAAVLAHPAGAAVLGRPAGAGRRIGARHLGPLAGVAVLAGALTLLALQLRDAELGSAFAAVDPTMLAVGMGWFALSLLAAAYTVTGFSPLPLRLSTTVVAALGAGSGTGLARPDGRTALVAVGVLAGLALVGWIAAALSSRVRAGVVATWRGQIALARHARRHPGRVAAGVVASGALTLFHVLAFAACVSAAGGSLPLVTLAAVYLGAATAGSLVPAPGGIGPVEAALVAGLTAAGMPLPAATAAALLSRLVSVWLPAVPGLAAAAVLRRRALL
jgi:uncharacterized membrane protein YbhN (UPF0104 family)